MNVDTYNVLISSKNKKKLDTNTEFTVKLDDSFFNKTSDETYVCMNQFHTIKSFYSVQQGLNDHFQVIVRLENDDPYNNIEDTFDFYIQEGNYNVNTFVKEIKRLTNTGYFDMIYDSRVNKYLFKNSYQTGFEVFLKPINSGILFGFENNVEYFIDVLNGTYSSKFVNLSGYTSLVIKLEEGLNIQNSISNIEDANFKFDKILAVLNINDKAPMDSITFENDGCLFKHKVVNDQMYEFKIKIVNEDGQKFPDMADWIMSLRFEKIKKVNQFNIMERLLARINFYLGAIFLYFDIPIPITLEDMQRLN
jgi:hypothetical protein